MALPQHGFTMSRPLGAAAVAAVACVSTYLYIRPILSHRNKPARTAIARGRDRLDQTGTHPYPPDVFPGGRDVDTPYGTIKVFEWGPVDGEKVLLLHGIGTPAVALGDMAKRFVSRGCRVMVFDLFGRGYSDAPEDVPYDDRLYTSQIFLALASSSLPWTGDAAFHVLGYSLGGALAASLAAYFPHMLRSATLVCPGGLIRPSHVSLKNRFLYSEGIMPEWFQRRLIGRRLQPQHGPSADVPVDDDRDVDFDAVSLTKGGKIKVGDAMRWQLGTNDGLVTAYISTIRNAPVYGQHDLLWKRLSERLAERRESGDVPPGMPGGKVCLVLAERDPVVVKHEWIEDSKRVLGEDGVDIHVVSGGHEIAISKGETVADLAMLSWGKGLKA